MDNFLTETQLNKFSDILVVIGEVLFASTVIPTVFGIENLDPDVLPSGLTITLFSWFYSIYILRERKK